MTSHSPLATVAETDQSNYMLRSRLEILYVLRAVLNKNELVTAYFNHGKDFLLTSLLGIDEESPGTLILDCSANELLNRQLLASERIILVTTQERVKIQFALDRIQAIEYLGRPAFKAPLPGELLKLQRREYYRLDTPLINAIKCTMTKPEGGSIEVVISDISLGGIAISNYQHLIRLFIGEQFSNCRIVLPEIGTTTPAVEVRNEHSVTLKNGTAIQRAGCRFVDLPANQQTLIQRYIIKLERERRSIRSQ